MASDRSSKSLELVPLSERLLYMQFFRGGVVLLVSFIWLFASEGLGAHGGSLLLPTAAYVLVSVASQLLWRRMGGRGHVLFSLMLITDGLYLAWLAYSTGGLGSLLHYLVFPHVVAVTLLASYRSGLKMAMWHSLLLFVTFHAQESGVLRPVEAGITALPGSVYQRMTVFALVFWAAALVTASFSAVNERELRRRRFDLEALAVLAARLEAVNESSDVGTVLVDNVVEAFGFPQAVLLGGEDDDFQPIAFRAWEPPASSGRRPFADAAIQHIQRTKQTLLLRNLHVMNDPWLAAAFSPHANLALVPATAEGRCVGVLVVTHSMKPGSRIERRVVSMLERFASQAALALRNAWLLEKVQRMAAVDGLTGVANRRTFESTLHRELSRATRHGQEVSLVMVDIDHFKKLNDAHGHQVGDEVLQRVAGLLASGCRNFDLAARYGGEEFAVILPATTAEQAVTIAERLRSSLATSDTIVPVTASMGVASFPLHGSDPGALVRTADAALYESKRGGRDRVTLAVATGSEGKEIRR